MAKTNEERKKETMIAAHSLRQLVRYLQAQGHKPIQIMNAVQMSLEDEETETG